MPAAFLRLVPVVFVVLWSTGFIAAKYAAPVASPFSFLMVRMLAVMAILGGVVAVSGRRLPRASMAARAMIVGMLIHSFYLGGVFWAVKHGLPSGFSALIVGLQPMLTMMVAAVLLKEAVTGRHLVGLVLGFIGVALVLAPRFSGWSDGVTVETVGICALSVLSMSFGTVYQKKHVHGIDLVTATFLQYCGATIAIVPMAAAEGFHIVPGWQLWLTLAWLVVVVSIGAILLLLRMIAAGRVSEVAALFYLVPPTGAIMAYVLFGESLGPIQIAGTALVVFAVALATSGPRSK